MGSAEEKWVLEEEEEEEMGLQARQFRHLVEDATDATHLVIDSTNDIMGKSSSSTSIDSGIEEDGNGEIETSNGGTDAVGENGTTLQKNSVYFDKEEGTESTYGFSGTKYGGVEHFVTEINTAYEELDVAEKKFDIQKNLSTEINHQLEENLDEENTSFKYDNETRIDTDAELIEEINQEVTDLDVEGVLKKQNTHDLYCPKCKSCITRRVILRKRKRNFQNVPRKEWRETLAKEGDSELDANPDHAADGQDPGCRTIAANDDSRDREPADIFRCLSCLSFFIPAGSNDTENPEKKCSENPNWLRSLFASKRKTATDPGDAAPAPNDGSDDLEAPLVDGSALSRQSQIQMDQKIDIDAIANKLPGDAAPAHNGATDILYSLPDLSDDMPRHDGTDDPAAPLVNGSAISAKSQTQIDQKYDGEAIADEQPIKKGEATLIPTTLPTESLSKGGLVLDASTAPQEPGICTGLSSTEGPTFVQKVKTDVGGKLNDALKNNNAGDSVVIIMDRGPEQNTETRILIQTPDRPRDVGASEAAGWDILKSIVYGGLIESITSLGVVSSAAGSGSSTLNIFALGLANLIGGLFVIVHNLIDLRNDHSGESSNQSNRQEDKYQEVLGRKENFLRHAITVVLSFLIFGSLPPVIYSFSFRKSDNRDLKLAVVAASSLFCIILLAIGKAHIRNRSYPKTMLKYVTIGIMSSGMSYVIGDLIDKLLEKLGLFESSLAVSTPPQTRLIQRAWASY